VAKLTDEERAQLEAEREFLVRSLDDLENERFDSAIDEATYETLHSDYTARAAAVLRTLESGNAPKKEKAPPVPKGRRVFVLAGIAVFAGLAAFTLARSSGTRASGGLPTGGVTTPTAAPTSYAGHLARAEQFRAEGITDQATDQYLAAAKLRPKSAEPLVDIADMLLTRYATGLDNDTRIITESAQLLDHAAQLEPNYGPAFFDKGLLLAAQQKPVAQSVAAFRKYLDVDPTGAQAATARSLIQQLTAPSTTTIPSTGGATTTTKP
jgi:hypothetical protein